jgi:hypothetical protein
MRFIGFGVMEQNTVTVNLTQEECDLLADGMRDGSADYPIESEDVSISGQLSQGFRALHTILELNKQGH